MEKYFEKGNLDEEELAKGLTQRLAHQQIFPVFCASGLKDMEVEELWDLSMILRHLQPIDQQKLENGGELKCDASDKTTIFIYKTLSEPQVEWFPISKCFQAN